jgi:hypothetical protein
MWAFLNKHIIVDGKTSDGATCFMEPAVQVEDWTAYQTVTIPAERKFFCWSASSSGGFRPIHRGKSSISPSTSPTAKANPMKYL